MDAQSMELDPDKKNEDSDSDSDQNSLYKDNFKALDDYNTSGSFWLDDLYNISIARASKKPKNLKELMDSEEMFEKINVPTKNDKNDQKKYCYFILLDPSEQIVDLLKNNEEYFDRVTKELQHEQNILRDIYDGIKYREFYSSLSLEERKNYVSMVFNTDGAAKFKCSKQSVWPLYLMINELPIQIRTKHLVVCGLIFGPNKPDMTIFLDKFVDLINNIRIPCTINNQERLLKIYILTCCVDAVARAPIQGIKQFNGHYGCSWCLHPGVTVGVKRFPVMRKQPELRQHDEMISLMLEADSENPKFGVRFPSPLMNLPQFDVVDGFIPDYLHMALEGVGKQFSSYHLAHLSDDKLEELDDIMLSIAVPLQIARRTRKITDREKWKAREWENFILYYSPVIFDSLLTEDLMEHWLLFVESLYIIISDKIDVRDLDKADEKLHKFVAKIENLYDVTACTYNVHQLLHICKSVLNWGPAWCNSTFCFESANHYVLKSIKCARGASEQVIRFIKMSHSLMLLEEKIMKTADDSVVQYCEDALMSRTRCSEEFQKCLFFNPITEDDTRIKSFNIPMPPEVRYFLKIVKNNCVYESYLIEKKRSNNSYAKLKNNSFVRIVAFIIHNENSMVLVNYVDCRRKFPDHYKYFFEILLIKEQIEIVPTENIERICVNINEKFIVPVPNLLQY
uniref:Uncharacterized protein n=1 Tax=Trichogramma kaykai TaxID=54128 RepID=A0ABD2WXD5_9HYME